MHNLQNAKNKESCIDYNRIDYVHMKIGEGKVLTIGP